jgi:hypothetical protein
VRPPAPAETPMFGFDLFALFFVLLAIFVIFSGV